MNEEEVKLEKNTQNIKNFSYRKRNVSLNFSLVLDAEHLNDFLDILLAAAKEVSEEISNFKPPSP